MEKENIVLIGMPSSGKSSVGTHLAEILGMKFIDTDTMIINKEKRALRDIVNNDGLEKFLEIQEQTILEMNLKNYVIATGGSVVYGDASMNHFKKTSRIIYLQYEFEEIESRITPERRFARNQEKSFRDLYDERAPLYQKYADIIFRGSTIRTPEENAIEIARLLSGEETVK